MVSYTESEARIVREFVDEAFEEIQFQEYAEKSGQVLCSEHDDLVLGHDDRWSVRVGGKPCPRCQACV